MAEIDPAQLPDNLIDICIRSQVSQRDRALDVRPKYPAPMRFHFS